MSDVKRNSDADQAKKVAERESVSDYFALLLKTKKRRLGVLVIHILTLIAVAHLAWVSFVLKTPENPLPDGLVISALLFGLVYLSVFVLWLISVPFRKIVPANIDAATVINQLLFKSISYISPLRASKYTGKSEFRSEMPIFKILKYYYYNEVMIVIDILLLYVIFTVILRPEKAVASFVILNSPLGFFGVLLIVFYGAGSASAALILRMFCSLFSSFDSLNTNI
jgi:hypothetical protein